MFESLYRKEYSFVWGSTVLEHAELAKLMQALSDVCTRIKPAFVSDISADSSEIDILVAYSQYSKNLGSDGFIPLSQYYSELGLDMGDSEYARELEQHHNRDFLDTTVPNELVNATKIRIENLTDTMYAQFNNQRDKIPFGYRIQRLYELLGDFGHLIAHGELRIRESLEDTMRNQHNYVKPVIAKIKYENSTDTADRMLGQYLMGVVHFFRNYEKIQTDLQS